MVEVRVRYFAAAAAAAGTDSERLTLPQNASIGDLERHLSGRGGELARVLVRCTFLCDGFAVRDRAQPLSPGTIVDVLPPFAGG